MKRNKLIVMMMVAACVLTSCTKREEKKAASYVKVTTEKVAETPLNGGQTFSGTVEEENATSLSFASGGTIKSLYVSQGQMVQRGALLAEVDETSLRNAHEATLAARRQAEDAYNRMKQLHDNNSLPEIQWIEVQSKLKQAVSSEQIAKKSLTDSRLYAPFSGFISSKTAEVGQNIIPGMAILKLVKIDRVKIKISVPENEIAHIRKGQTVRIRISALGGKIINGTVSEKGVEANPLSRSYDVKVLVVNSGNKILPGMVCDVFLNGDASKNAIVLPANILSLNSDNQTFVWLNVNGKATKRIVNIGEQTADGVVITSGLSFGDEVIVEGQQKVCEGTKVTTK